MYVPPHCAASRTTLPVPCQAFAWHEAHRHSPSYGCRIPEEILGATVIYCSILLGGCPHTVNPMVQKKR